MSSARFDLVISTNKTIYLCGFTYTVLLIWCLSLQSSNIISISKSVFQLDIDACTDNIDISFVISVVSWGNTPFLYLDTSITISLVIVFSD